MNQKRVRKSIQSIDPNAFSFTLMNDIEATHRIRRVYRSLFFNESLVYFANLAMQLDFVPTNQVETIACDGSKLYFNPDFTLKNNVDVIRFAICRVVIACALQHHTRRGNRQYNRWQEASRIVTLPLIAQAGETQGACSNTTGVDKSIEQVYDQLPEDEEDEGSPDPNGQGEIIDFTMDGTEPQQKDLQAENQKWDEIALQTLSLANSQGWKNPDISNLIRSRHSTTVDWRGLLQHLLTTVGTNDHTWAYPNRRFVSSDMYLPSLRSAGMPPMVFAIDTSYSMSENALNAVWDEISIVAGIMNPEKLVIIHCDEEVHKVEEFMPYELPERIEAVGRNGTSFTPTFNYVEKKHINPACLIYLTDLGVWWRENYPDNEPSYPVIWATFNGPEPGDYGVYSPPFGKRVDVVIE